MCVCVRVCVIILDILWWDESYFYSILYNMIKWRQLDLRMLCYFCYREINDNLALAMHVFYIRLTPSTVAVTVLKQCYILINMLCSQMIQTIKNIINGLT